MHSVIKKVQCSVTYHCLPEKLTEEGLVDNNDKQAVESNFKTQMRLYALILLYLYSKLNLACNFFFLSSKSDQLFNRSKI